MAQKNEASEVDRRQAVIQSLLETPHRDLMAVYPFHLAVAEQDPLFYHHLAAWYFKNGEIRDHKELFVATLCTSKFEPHREVGLALLNDLAPYQVARVVSFIKGDEVDQKVESGKVKKKVKDKKTGKMVEKEVSEYKTQRAKVGLFKIIPTSMRKEVKRYLQTRERNQEQFDSILLSSRNAVKGLYASLRIPQSERTHAILFDNNPPPDCPLYFVKLLGREKNKEPAEIARIIVQNRIPYRVATSLFKTMTPVILAALLSVMTPQEVISNLASLKERGAFDNADLKAVIDQKLAEAKKDKRVSALKTEVAAKAAQAAPELAKQLDQVATSRIQAKGRITRSTALLIDKSSSMNESIQLGMHIASVISTVIQAEFYVWAFNNAAYPIALPQEKTLAGWQKAFQGVISSGNTSCGTAVAQMIKMNQKVEQFIFVTDEEENENPRFEHAYAAYVEKFKIRPSVTIIQIGHVKPVLSEACKRLGIDTNILRFSPPSGARATGGADYYSMPNLIPLLASPGAADLVNDILSFPLPKRRLQKVAK